MTRISSMSKLGTGVLCLTIGAFFASTSAASAGDSATTDANASTTSTDKAVALAPCTNQKVSCVGPHAACAESEKIIEILKSLTAAYTEGNLKELSSYLDDNVYTFDEGTKKLIVGKEAVVKDIQRRWELAKIEDAPVLSYTINHPYAQVTGDRAVVTFEAIKTIGGKHPETLISHCTDIFVKHDDGWKKLHFRANWKKAKASDAT